MSLRIRMARGGAKKRPYFRIVVADSRKPRDGRYIERLGTYNPLLPKDHDNRVSLDEERIRHWLSVGALPSDRVNRFFDAAGIMKREPKNNPVKGQPGQKRLDREEAKREAEAKAKEEAEATATEEAGAEAAEPEPADEAPAEVEAAAAAPAEEETKTKAEPAPAEETTAEAQAEEAAAEDVPAEEAKADETPAEEVPAEDSSGEDEAKKE